LITGLTDSASRTVPCRDTYPAPATCGVTNISNARPVRIVTPPAGAKTRDSASRAFPGQGRPTVHRRLQGTEIKGRQ
jgi:hypothetical protein